MARPLPKKTSYRTQVRQYLTGMTINNPVSSNPGSRMTSDNLQELNNSDSRKTDSRNYEPKQYRDQNDSKRNISTKKSGDGGFTFKQNLFFWLVTSAMIFFAFVIGFKSGQKRGALEVLDQASNQMVRLPIVRPVGSES